MGRLDIPQVSKGFFATIMPFRTDEGKNCFDYHTFRKTIQDVLSTQQGQVGSKRIDTEIYEDARYAMVGLVDELAIFGGWAYKHEWGQEPLQLALFNSNIAGERFFELLQNLESRFSQSGNEEEKETILGALEVFFTCIECGFQGRYRGFPEGERELSGIRKRLLALLWPGAEERGHATLFPAAYGEGGKAEQARRRMNKWPFIVAILVVAVFGLYVAFQFMLGRTAKGFEKEVEDKVTEALQTPGEGE
jgi:type IV/VI secretion system ImpK/VasF family protein